MTFPSTIPAALASLKAARCPEAVLGDDPSTIQDSYRALAKVCHEDMASVEEKPLAHEAFLLLTKLYEAAQVKVAKGTYGDGKPLVTAVLRTKTASYSLTGLLRADELSDLYEGIAEPSTRAVWVRLVRSPSNNDLLKAEADLLARLPADLPADQQPRFPNLLDSFEVGVGKARRRANVFAALPGLVSLDEVHSAYPSLDPRDAAWMWNRLIETLHLLHSQGHLHGAVTMDRFLIDPAAHTAVLFDFAYSARIAGTVKAIVPRWRQDYPPEVLAKIPLDPSMDLYMAARCMEHLLGNPFDAPQPIQSLLRACTLGRAHRIRSAETLHSDFAAILRQLYGPPAFRVLAWPPVTEPVPA